MGWDGWDEFTIGMRLLVEGGMVRYPDTYGVWRTSEILFNDREQEFNRSIYIRKVSIGHKTQRRCRT